MTALQARLAGIALLVVCAGLGPVAGAAWGFWSGGSAPGSGGAAATATVDQGPTPSLAVSGRSVTVTWASSRLSNGDPVSGYLVRRLDARTLVPQTVGTGCAGTLAATTCTEARVPAGQWVYAVVASVGASWRGPSSAPSSPVTVAGPGLTLSTTPMRPGASTTGSASGFLPAETVRYRLDDPAGTELSGTLAGNPTPADVPAGGGGPVSVTVPPGTADGAHRVYAVASPSGDVASAAIVVDGTAPPAPVLTQTPAATSGDRVTFAFREDDASATVECRLDAAAFAPCQSPREYTRLAQGSHTFQVRATDAAANVSPLTSYTWTVNTTLPTVTIGFPQMGAAYNDPSFTAGCGTPAAGDLCGTASDALGTPGTVQLSIRRQSTSLYWNGTGFTSATEVFLPASGSGSWSYPMAASAFPTEGAYTVTARTTDGTGLTATNSVSFTVDRTAPSQPVILSGPTGTTRGTNDTFYFSGGTGGSLECRLDDAAWQACTSPRTLTGLSTGSHTFAVRAVDPAGNASAASTRTWTVDATGPTVATTFPAAGGRYNNAGYDSGCTAGTGDLCGTAGDPGSGVARVDLSLQRAGTGLYLSGTTFGSVGQNWIRASGTTSWSYALAATTFPADDAYVLSVRATDGVGNTTTTTTTFRIDRTRPTAAGFTTSNAGTVSRLGAGDTFTLTYSEPVAPGSVIAGWPGTGTQNVVVRLSSGQNRLTVYNSADTTQLPVGTISLQRSDYASAPVKFGASGTRSTLAISGNSLVVTLGTPSATPTTAAGAANVTWTPASGVTDVAGNGTATTSYTETDNDRDF